MSETRRAGDTPIYQRALLEAGDHSDEDALPSVRFRRDLRERADELHRLVTALWRRP